MKKSGINTMKPQDLVVLAKLIALGDKEWTQLSLAKDLFVSQSEISSALARCRYANLLGYKGKTVHRKPLYVFIQYGLAVVFPQQPGVLVRGTATAHSAEPLSNDIRSTEAYVWPYGKGDTRGQSIMPLYPSVTQAVQLDPILYKILALMDAMRVGRARERNLALEYLKELIC